ncbi:hypothetical protein DFH08DRAFT_820517 [Mycena albidolilacea]|uniref:Uncharacterized protein n=1 Tax=Mycena albidolilacea TaxID=1033008 RepID=A0AAD6ZC34_9AGAR|nr:hypothetical protein DFH08DRAFT_820517 [Mycena albidolilacea]
MPQSHTLQVLQDCRSIRHTAAEKPLSAAANCQFCRCQVLLTAAAECLHMFGCRHTAADCRCIENIPWINVVYKTLLNSGLRWNNVLDTGEYPGTFQTTNYSDTKEFNMCLPLHAAKALQRQNPFAPSNAEEAMHWKIYAAVGDSFSLLDGLRALVQFAEYYESQSNAKKLKHSFAILGLQLKASDGVKIHYGEDRQYWKRTAEVHGRTKLSRLPGSGKRTKNEADYPTPGKHYWDRGVAIPNCNTSNATHGNPTRVGLIPASPQYLQPPPGNMAQAWNRCLRDSQTIILFGTCSSLSKPVRVLTLLSMSPGGLKYFVLNATAFGWLDDITSHVVPAGHDKKPSGLEWALSYFRLTAVSLRKCSGSMTGEQYRLGKIRYRDPCVLSSTLYHQYDGNITKWFLEFMRVTQPVPLSSCWHSVDSIQLCDGQAVLFDIILNIPIALILHVDSATGSTESDAENIWNVPKSLSPLGKNSDATSRGVKYNIASHVYFSAASSHFIVRYCSSDAGKPRIFDYDGKKHDGHAVLRSSTGLLGLHFVVNGSSETGIPSSCDVRLPGISRVDGLDRYWLAPGTSAIDYNLPLPDKSPRKKPKLPTMPVTRSESQAPQSTAHCSNKLTWIMLAEKQEEGSGPYSKIVPPETSSVGFQPSSISLVFILSSAGKGSLARHGNYWYPVRLVMKAKSGWTVAWWRGNEYDDPSPPPTLVLDSDLRMSYGPTHKSGGEFGKLGKWVHASEIVPEDDLLSEFRHIPYTDEIDPHLAQLQRLHDYPSGPHPNIPAVQVALRNLSAKGPGSEALRGGGISSTSELEMIDCARVVNRFYRNIVGAAHSVVQWFGRAPLAHAYTILIAHLNHESIQDVMNDDPDYAQMDREAAAFQIAWEFQPVALIVAPVAIKTSIGTGLKLSLVSSFEGSEKFSDVEPLAAN